MEEVNQNPDFKHGYTSGVEGAATDPYEQFLTSDVHYGWLSQRIDERRSELNILDQKRA